MAITSYEDLQVYQEGYKLAIEIHRLKQEVIPIDRKMGSKLRKISR